MKAVCGLSCIAFPCTKDIEDEDPANVDAVASNGGCTALELADSKVHNAGSSMSGIARPTCTC